MPSRPDHYPRLTALAATFPTLRNPDLRGVAPFDAETVVRDLRSPAHTNASRHAARFVLAVFNCGIATGGKHFEVVAAMASWDSSHQRAFLAWAEAPWWG